MHIRMYVVVVFYCLFCAVLSNAQPGRTSEIPECPKGENIPKVTLDQPVLIAHAGQQFKKMIGAHNVCDIASINSITGYVIWGDAGAAKSNDLTVDWGDKRKNSILGWHTYQTAGRYPFSVVITARCDTDGNRTTAHACGDGTFTAYDVMPIKSFDLDKKQATYGDTVYGRISLKEKATAMGVLVYITSSDPDIQPDTSALVIEHNLDYAAFSITIPSRISGKRSVNIFVNSGYEMKAALLSVQLVQYG